MQRPTQEFPSPSTGGDHEAMKSAQSAAISANEKVFPVFVNKLASKDAKEFAGTARKLIVWLKSEKAYYPAARPRIIELLEIALSAFTDTFAHHPAFAEFADLLNRLIQTVIPFKNLFSEYELQSRLQRVIADAERAISTIAKRITQDKAVPQGVAITDTPPLTITSPVNIQPQSITHPVIPRLPSPRKPSLQLQPPSVPSAVKTISDDFVHVGSPQMRNPTPRLSEAFLTSPVIGSPRETGGNISPSVSFKPQPKRARKAELSEDLIARDLDWFRANQTSAPVNEASSQVVESSSVLSPDIPYSPGRPPSPKRKTTRMVPCRRLPRRISLDVQTTDFAPLHFEPPVEGTEYLGNAHASVESVNWAQPSLDGMRLDARSAATPDLHGMQEVFPQEESPNLHPVAASFEEPSIKPGTPLMDQPSSSAQDTLLNGESTLLPAPSTPLLGTTLHQTASVGISPSAIGDGIPSEPLHKSESAPTSPQLPRMLQLQTPVLPPPVVAWEPPLDLNFDISRISPGDPQQSMMDTDRRRFDGQMTVILSTRGKPFTHGHKIDFSLEDSVFAEIAKWVNRRFRPAEAPHGVCISLACYELAGFFDKIKPESGKPNLETLTSQSPCSWPHSNRLSLRINEDKRPTVISLAPPLFLNPDRCVDVSSLLKPGNNTLEIMQQGDLSEYLFVLHAHHPTRAQLSELDVVKVVDERWKLFLSALSAQVGSGKMLGTTPAGAVGVF